MTNKKGRCNSGKNDFPNSITRINFNTKQGITSIPVEGIKFSAVNPITGRRVTVGTLYPTGVFCKTVAEKSRLRAMDAFGIEATTIDQLAAYGCREIHLTVRDTGETYSVDFPTFNRLAVRRTFGHSSYQAYLPMKYWQKLDGAKQLSFV